jgi:hypothetical protein
VVQGSSSDACGDRGWRQFDLDERASARKDFRFAGSDSRGERAVAMYSPLDQLNSMASSRKLISSTFSTISLAFLITGMLSQEANSCVCKHAQKFIELQPLKI